MLVQGWWRAARFGLPGVLLGVVLAWTFQGERGLHAQTPPGGERPRVLPAGDASGTIAFTTPTSGSAQLLYLIDTRTKSFVLYRIDPSNAKGTVKLEGARQYQWDLKLTEFNNQQPEVSAVESMVKALGQPSR